MNHKNREKKTIDQNKGSRSKKKKNKTGKARKKEGKDKSKQEKGQRCLPFDKRTPVHSRRPSRKEDRQKNEGWQGIFEFKPPQRSEQCAPFFKKLLRYLAHLPNKAILS